MVGYTLTDRAKELAKELVDAWEENTLPQRFHVQEVTGYGELIDIIVYNSDFTSETLRIEQLVELDEHSLLRIASKSYDRGDTKVEIVLLQKLREVVANNFQLIPFDIATQTSLPVATALKELTIELKQILGEDLLSNNRELREAIEKLARATEAEKQHKVGKAISELGNSLAHGANAATIIPAIIMLAHYYANAG